jgi:hypothetical protein
VRPDRRAPEASGPDSQIGLSQASAPMIRNLAMFTTMDRPASVRPSPVRDEAADHDFADKRLADGHAPVGPAQGRPQRDSLTW